MKCLPTSAKVFMAPTCRASSRGQIQMARSLSEHHGAKLIGIFATGEKQPSTFPSPRAQTDRQSIGARSMQEVGSCSIALSILLSGSAECARAPFDPQKASSIFCALPPDRFLKKNLITDARAGPPREISSEDCVSAKAWRRT